MSRLMLAALVIVAYALGVWTARGEVPRRWEDADETQDLREFEARVHERRAL